MVKIIFVFTVRSHQLRRQPGEISFPGGHCESTDKTGADAAIRECSEELGIAIEQIKLLGPLDCLVSAIGVKLHAVVVRLHTSEFNPNNAEVGENLYSTIIVFAQNGTYCGAFRYWNKSHCEIFHLTFWKDIRLIGKFVKIIPYIFIPIRHIRYGD